VSSREPDQYGLQSVHQALFSSYYLAENTAVEIQAHFAASAILLRVISIDRWYQGMAILRIGVIKNQDRPAALRISHCIQQYCEKVKN
jgi:hypothetical protein